MISSFFSRPRALAIGLSALLSAGAPADGDSARPPASQGAALLKVDILGVFAHPDDETGVASTVAYYALGRRKSVDHVYLTRGEGGGNMVGTQWGPALGLLREAELRGCLATLGVRSCYFLDQLDWAYTESLAATLRKWGKEESLGRLVRVVRALRPEVIVTMNPTPNPGQHGHHQAAGVLAIEAFSAAADPTRFPEQLRKEGLSVWQTRKLYVGGRGTNATEIIPLGEALPDGRTPGQIAAEALSHHRSQAFGSFAGAPWLTRPQSFILVKSVVGYPDHELDLLAQISEEPASAGGRRLRVARSPEPDFAFVPRPAIENFQRWIRDQGVEHLAGRFRADVPLVAGRPNPVSIEIAKTSAAPSSGLVRLSAPAGWTIEPSQQRVPPPSVASRRLVFQVTPPAGQPADGELIGEWESPDRTVFASAIGHPVPIAKIPRVRRAPALDGSDRGWAEIPAIRIASTNLVQGSSAGDADNSASFRLAHDGRRLYLDVEVSDDRVVSNIAPNDIRGHWRSDSVEICIDPAGGSEDTMGCYKLGIFPFDATGVVRAARDADAKQGPVEETSPGTKLSSSRIPGGYRIQASIPFDEIGAKPRRGRRLGFNLIVYDGDKIDAAPGENINKSRIAWAPRPGVQGRPEDWGRVELE